MIRNGTMPLIVVIKVVPSSGRSACVLTGHDQLKCHLKNAPERGKANAELVAMLAKALRVPRADVSIITGHTARTKKIKIDRDISFNELCIALGIERQLDLFAQKE